MFLRILLIGAIAAAIVPAQEGGGGGGGRGGGDMGAPNPSARISKLDTMTKACNLNKDQQKQFKTIFSIGSKEAEQIRKQAPQLRNQIAAAVQAGKAKAEIDPLVKSYSEMLAQATAMEIKAFGKAYALLDPDQKKQGGQRVFALVTGMFMKNNWEYD